MQRSKRWATSSLVACTCLLLAVYFKYSGTFEELSRLEEELRTATAVATSKDRQLQAVLLIAEEQSHDSLFTAVAKRARSLQKQPADRSASPSSSQFEPAQAEQLRLHFEDQQHQGSRLPQSIPEAATLPSLAELKPPQQQLIPMQQHAKRAQVLSAHEPELQQLVLDSAAQPVLADEVLVEHLPAQLPAAASVLPVPVQTSFSNNTASQCMWSEVAKVRDTRNAGGLRLLNRLQEAAWSLARQWSLPDDAALPAPHWEAALLLAGLALVLLVFSRRQAVALAQQQRLNTQLSEELHAARGALTQQRAAGNTVAAELQAVQEKLLAAEATAQAGERDNGALREQLQTAHEAQDQVSSTLAGTHRQCQDRQKEIEQLTQTLTEVRAENEEMSEALERYQQDAPSSPETNEQTTSSSPSKVQQPLSNGDGTPANGHTHDNALFDSQPGSPAAASPAFASTPQAEAWREQCRTEASTEVVAKYMTHLRQARTASHSKQAALDARVAEGDRLRAELLQVRGQVRQLQDKHRLLQSDLRSAHQSLAAAQEDLKAKSRGEEAELRHLRCDRDLIAQEKDEQLKSMQARLKDCEAVEDTLNFRIGSIMRMKRMSEDMRQVLLHRKIQEAANWQQRCGVLQRKLRQLMASQSPGQPTDSLQPT